MKRISQQISRDASSPHQDFLTAMTTIQIRKALIDDIPRIVFLLQNGRPNDERSDLSLEQDLDQLLKAFERIDSNENAFLMVAEIKGLVVGTFQLNYLTYLVGKGAEDAQIEAVHVDASFRGRGIGTQMINWVIEHAKSRKCRRIQLMTDKRRTRAHRFYERLGFSPSHEGMKLQLT